MNSITDAFKSKDKLIVINNDQSKQIITIYKDGSDDLFEFNYSEAKILIEKLKKVMGIEEEPAMDWTTKRMNELKNKSEDEIDELQEQMEMY